MNNQGESTTRMKKARQGLARRLNRLPLLAPFVVGAAIVANAITLVQPNYDWEDVGIALGIVLGVCAVVAWLSYRLFKRVATSAFAAILTLLVLAYFNTIEAKLLVWFLNSPLRFMARAVVIIGLMGLTYAGLIWWFDSKLSRKRRINLVMNMAAAAMLGVPLVQITTAWHKYRHLTAEPFWAHPGPLNLTATNKPDIYFIILDSYTSNESLKKYWDYDNSEFTEFLKSHGFYIASNAQSCSAWTTWSISSSLNMYYDINHIPECNELYCWLAGAYRVRKSIVPELFGALGYRFINISPFYIAKQKPFYELSFSNIGYSIIDLLIKPGIMEFVNKVTKIKKKPSFLGVDSTNGFAFAQSLANEQDMRPRFIYLHVGIPHAPYVFDENGITGNVSNEPKDYIRQLKYTNIKCVQLIKAIIGASPDAVIILGGDHGCRHMAEERMYKTKLGLINPSISGGIAGCKQTAESFAILKAVRFPKIQNDIMWDNIIPIDDFRLVFNQYFGANYPYLSKPTNATETANKPEDRPNGSASSQ